MKNSSSPKILHIALFPFMSKGHTIPLLHLIKLVHRHRPRATFTIFTTRANEPFISTSLSSVSPNVLTIVTLSAHLGREGNDNENHDSDNNGVPPRVEGTKQSTVSYHSYICSLESLQPVFETTLENIQNGENPITFLIYDFFLYWTQNVTSKYDIPILYFNGMNVYHDAISRAVLVNKAFDGVESVDEEFQVPGFDWIRLTMSDFNLSVFGPETDGITRYLVTKMGYACSRSYGVVVNSFEELELEFLKYLNSNSGQKAWCVGPLCLVDKPKVEAQTPPWMEWLDKRREERKSVLYVAFGTQAEIANDQLKEMALGLEKSGVDFLWALRIKPTQEEAIEGFEERVRDRGMVVSGWVEQRAILEHESVHGFLSHCGWNSVIESVCAGVPILAWPIMAEQHLNARMAVEEVKVGLRVETCDGSVRGFVKSEGLSKMVKELMCGELGKNVRKNVSEYSLLARKVVDEGGSSWANLETLLNEFDKV